jgi:hypothetical protein
MEAVLSLLARVKFMGGFLQGSYKVANPLLTGPTTAIEHYTAITQIMSFQKCPKMSSRKIQ